GGSLLWSIGARADTFTWVGGSPETEEYTPSFADLFVIPDSPNGLGSHWAAGGVLKRNWQRADGSTPTRSPNENDSVIFGSGFHSGVPLSVQDRVIHDLTLDADHDLVVAFIASGNLKTLGLVSGALQRTAGSSGNHFIDGNVVNFQPAVWDID